MKALLTYSLLSILLVSALTISGCKDFRKFKESRAELKKEKQEVKEDKEQAEVIIETESNTEKIEGEKEIKTDSLFFS